MSTLVGPEDFTEVRCVAFDIDDTLCAETDYVRSGFAAVGQWVAANLQLAGFAERAWARFERGCRGEIFNQVLADCAVDYPPQLIARLVEIYRRHDPDLELWADARACLQQLQGGLTLVAITDGCLPSQQAKVGALGLDRWLAFIIYTAELGCEFGKPHPKAFEIVQERTGWRGAQCLYVADNPRKDFAGPRRLGWQTVRIRRPEGLHYALASGPDVDRELPDLGELPRLWGVDC